MAYDDEGDHEVGYGKPPRRSQFVKGQSGNPRGRPPGAKNLSRQSRNQRGDSIVRRCQSCREPDDGVAHGAL